MREASRGSQIHVKELEQTQTPPSTETLWCSLPDLRQRAWPDGPSLAGVGASISRACLPLVPTEQQGHAQTAKAMIRVSLPLIARQSPATALGEGSLIRQRTRVQFPSPPPLPLVAQLERAAGFYPDGCRFESCRGGMCFDDRTKRSVLTFRSCGARPPQDRFRSCPCTAELAAWTSGS